MIAGYLLIASSYLTFYVGWIALAVCMACIRGISGRCQSHTCNSTSTCACDNFGTLVCVGIGGLVLIRAGSISLGRDPYLRRRKILLLGTKSPGVTHCFTVYYIPALYPSDTTLERILFLASSPNLSFDMGPGRRLDSGHRLGQSWSSEE